MSTVQPPYCVPDTTSTADGTRGAHRPLAALANRDVDTEDPGEESHPREPLRDPGIEEPPPPLLTHPVELALDVAHWCGLEPVGGAPSRAR